MCYNQYIAHSFSENVYICLFLSLPSHHPSFFFLSPYPEQSKVVGLSEANGNVEFVTPIVNATVNTVLLQTCPEKLQCLLICPSGNIKKTKQCSCDTTKTFLTTPLTTRSEVGFRDWRIRVGIGVFVILLVLASGTVLYVKRRSPRKGYNEREELRNPLLQDSLNMTKFMQLASGHKCFSSMHGTPQQKI
ncbi:hypothetical protein DPX16_6650 [Anabarilius grahami]|uniref:Uncharacterized protein n=1 Tax=Anabarilius grahami TaxID=495550 RepID=A0A3N0YPN3_ANAGA|nr:hypothetical protein DPX16_6650 [Anabarilius grahami]